MRCLKDSKQTQSHAHMKEAWFHKFQDENLIPELAGSNDDIVDGDKDQLDEEPHESHHHEPDGRAHRHLRELCQNESDQILKIVKMPTFSPVTTKLSNTHQVSREGDEIDRKQK